MRRSLSFNREEEEAEPEEEEEEDTFDWVGLFDRTRTVPSHCQTVHLVRDSHLLTRSEGFQLCLSRVAGAHLQQHTAQNSEEQEQQDVTYQLRVTLFDWTHQHFFGRTWKSSPQRMKSGHKIQFNEVLYFHTSLRLPSTVAVLELVALSVGPDGSQQHLGCGFTVLELFAGKAEARAADGDRRLTLHRGTPRSLLHPLLKSTEYGNILEIIDGAHLDCVVKGHPALGSVMHLLPENMLVSGHENIPGLTPSPTGDALLKPQLLETLSYTLDRLTVSLQPSLETFERELLQLVNDDCHNTKQLGPEGAPRTVAIQERRLHVGVHNGWGFVEKPQVVVLDLQSTGSRTRAGSISRQNAPTKDSSTSCRLALRSSLELRLTNHEALAIVFQLEYVFSAQLGRDTMLSATTTTSRAAFMQCLRWGALCPFQGSGDWKGEEVQLALQGSAMPNPYGVMVYSADTPTTSENPEPGSVPSTAQEVGDNKDVLRFRLWSTLEGKALSPKASLRTRQQQPQEEEQAARRRRPPSSPSLGQKPPPLASPPASPQGPGLSLSQLAATSRYLTISHSSAALPWQQPFPSLLYPSPLAPAHQLSHVACPAASNIAHLEVDLMRDDDGDMSIDGDPMSELPYTPVHAPVISLGMQVSSSCSASSRSSLAHLYSAGFPDILDYNGQVAEVLDPTEPVHFDPQHEEADPLKGNLLVFQFLAFSRIGMPCASADWPDSVYFTFQFYRFLPVTTQQLKLLSTDKAQQNASQPLPCVLASLNKDDTLNSGCPGLQVQFLVDESFLRPGEKRWFLRYLALHTMQVDIWDSSSLLLIGSTAIELKHMLRQGRSAVQALHEVEVLTTDYVGEDALLTSGGEPGRQRSPAPPLNVHTLVRGRLHVRTGNIGCPMDPKKCGGRELPPPRSHIISPHCSTVGFRGGSLAGRSVLRRNARNVARAQRLVEVDGDLVALLNSRIKNKSPVADGRAVDEPNDIRQRKLDRMAAVHQQEAKKDAESRVKTTAVMTRREERARLDRDLRVIEAYQDRGKMEGIANMLSQAITTQHVLYASLGTAEYMEFVLKNPFNVPQTVRIHSEDPDLSVITNTDEWRYFKELTRTPTPLEEDMFHLGEDDLQSPRVYLRPKESVHIPLKYQSLLCDHNMAPQGPSFLSAGESAQVAKRNPSNIVLAKSIKVTFRAEDGKPLAICQVNVEPTPHVIDQSFRLYHPERCFLKKAIRLPPWHSPPDTPVAEPDGGRHLSVRCSDPNVICQTKMLASGEPQDVYLKVPGCPSPLVKMFYVMVYTDKWLAAPAQVWQIYVHFLERVDVSCVAGQRSCQSLVLRGRQAVRKVKCFSSHPREIEMDPAGVFVLPPGAVQELRLQVQAWRAGSRFLYVHAVDVEQRRLVTAWLLCLNIHRPVLSKAFEVCVPVGGGKGSSRRLTYTNPYTSSRDFQLRSDHPELLQFKEDHFQIGGGESYTIGLRFAPCHNAGSAEIMVYVNDLDEKTEETFCVKVIYS